MTLAETSRPLVAEIAALRDELAAEGVDHVVLAGMGGSSLAPEVICATAGVELVTLDTTDPGQVAAALAEDLERTVLVVSSKSGGTVETDSHRRAYEKAFTDDGIDPKRRIVVVTDPGSPLQQTAEDAGYRKVFLADPNVGGRYSALTAFGLVPSGLAGADIGALLDDGRGWPRGAGHRRRRPTPGCGSAPCSGWPTTPAADKVVFADFGSGIVGFGDWAEQLIAESTGKNGRGLLPVVVEGRRGPRLRRRRTGRDPGAPRRLRRRPTRRPPAGAWPRRGPLGRADAAVGVRHRGGRPDHRHQPVRPAQRRRGQEAGPRAAGRPDDDAGRRPAADRRRRSRCSRTGFDLGSAPATWPTRCEAFFAAAPERGYVAIQAYLDRHADAAAADLRPAVAERTGLQTTFGWGRGSCTRPASTTRAATRTGSSCRSPADGRPQRPGRSRTGRTASPRCSAAQAAGDAKVLADKGRPVLHLHLTDRAAGHSAQLLQRCL